jgi:hypothetical protein
MHRHYRHNFRPQTMRHSAISHMVPCSRFTQYRELMFLAHNLLWYYEKRPYYHHIFTYNLKTCEIQQKNSYCSGVKENVMFRISSKYAIIIYDKHKFLIFDI